MDATILERAEKVASWGNRNRGFSSAEFREIEDVYRLLIGHYVECYNCVVYRLIREITNALNKEPLDFNPMAKYQFKANARGVKVIRHTEQGVTKVITSENLNKSDNAEYMLKSYPHLIEESKHKAEQEQEAEAQPEISQEKAEVAPEQQAAPEQEGEAKPAAKKSK